MKPVAAGNAPFLSDLAHLLQEMEKSFPQIHHARRKFGADIRARAAALAEEIAARTDVLAPQAFNALLNEYIFMPGVQQAGSRSWYAMPSNVGTLSRDFYLEFFLRTAEDASSPYGQYVRQLLRKPAVVEFYTGMGSSEEEQAAILALARSNRPVLQQRTAQGKLPTVVTDVPVAGKVARLRVDNMGPNMLYDPDFYAALEDRIFAFYDHVAGFEHLVFDVRGNPGGYTPFVERMLVGPHIDAPVELTGFVLFPDGAADPLVRLCSETHYPVDRYPRMEIGEMIDRGLLPDLDRDDAAILGSGAFNHWMTFSPTARRSPFKGRIWILIDEGTGSASEVFSILARQAGIARIVGEQSRGNYSKSRGQGSLFFLDLPHSGIVVTWDPAYFTDARGRHAHEHHVVPDHFNRPGMDALQTVLAIIDESAS